MRIIARIICLFIFCLIVHRARANGTNYVFVATNGGPTVVWSRVSTPYSPSNALPATVGYLRVWLNSGATAYISLDGTASTSSPVVTNSPTLIFDSSTTIPNYITFQPVSGIVTGNVIQLNR